VQSDGRSDVDKTPINLVGHSRGGAACIYVAPELHKQDIPVHSMLLFDAVDRTAGIDSTRIPPNVGYCLHLMRDPQFGDFFHRLPEYRQLRTQVMTAQKLPADAAGLLQFDWSAIAAKSGPSRELARLRRLDHYHTIMQHICRLNCTVRGVPTGFGFGNTGTLWSAPTRYLSQKFKATHGAMGGAPMQASKQIDDPLYWHLVADAEMMAMAQVQARARSFLRQMGELGKLKPGLHSDQHHWQLGSDRPGSVFSQVTHETGKMRDRPREYREKTSVFWMPSVIRGKKKVAATFSNVACLKRVL